MRPRRSRRSRCFRVFVFVVMGCIVFVFVVFVFVVLGCIVFVCIVFVCCVRLTTMLQGVLTIMTGAQQIQALSKLCLHTLFLYNRYVLLAHPVVLLARPVPLQ